MPSNAPPEHDSLLRHHVQSASGYSRQALDALSDASQRVERLDQLLDQLPDALEAVRDDVCSVLGSLRLVELVNTLQLEVTRVQEAAAHAHKLGEFSRHQSALAEHRRVELRRLREMGAPADRATADTSPMEPVHVC